jgi:hypothetical protein
MLGASPPARGLPRTMADLQNVHAGAIAVRTPRLAPSGLEPPAPVQAPGVARLLRLQRLAGNAAVLRLLAQAPAPSAAPVLIQREAFKLNFEAGKQPDFVKKPVKVKPVVSTATTDPNISKKSTPTPDPNTIEFELPDGKDSVSLKEILEARGFVVAENALTINDKSPNALLMQVRAGTHKILWNVLGNDRFTLTWPLKVTRSAGAQTGVKPKETLRENNERKLKLFREFVSAMKAIGINVFLFGGAAVNAALGSPRFLNDLDFRTDSLKENFNTVEGQKTIELMNHQVAKAFGASGLLIKPFVQADNNTYAVDGAIGDCQITVARTMTVQYQIENDVIAPKEILADKSLGFAVRVVREKRVTDLFDLIWTLHAMKMDPTDLRDFMEGARGTQYETQLSRRKVDDKSPRPSSKLSAQFAVALGEMMLEGFDRLLKALMANTDPEMKSLRTTVSTMLTKLGQAFGIPINKEGSKAAAVLLLQAGNFTGDMFGVCAALLLNPLAHILILGDGSSKDRTTTIVKFYEDSGVESVRIHTLNIGAENMGKTHRKYGDRPGKDKGVRQEIPYDSCKPPIPMYLRGVRLQQPVATATEQVASLWQKDTRAKLRKAWQVDSPTTITAVEKFLDGRHVPMKASKYVVVWSRFSGSKGGPHPQHDMGYQALKQILEIARDEGGVIIVAGDRPVSSNAQAKYAELIKSFGALNMLEFWQDSDFKSHVTSGRRFDQFVVFDTLNKQALGNLKHLGFRSGNLEAYVLLGHVVRYMEEAENKEAKRMVQWASTTTSRIGYDRLIIEGRLPTLKGQWVKAKTEMHGEARPPWLGDMGTDTKLKKEKMGEIIGSGEPKQHRGFEGKDLKSIRDYLKGSRAVQVLAMADLENIIDEVEAKGYSDDNVKRAREMLDKLHIQLDELKTLNPGLVPTVVGWSPVTGVAVDVAHLVDLTLTYVSTYERLVKKDPTLGPKTPTNPIII